MVVTKVPYLFPVRERHERDLLRKRKELDYSLDERKGGERLGRYWYIPCERKEGGRSYTR